MCALDFVNRWWGLGETPNGKKNWREKTAFGFKWLPDKKDNETIYLCVCKFHRFRSNQSITNKQTWRSMPALCNSHKSARWHVDIHVLKFTAAGQQGHQRLSEGGQSWVMSVLCPVWPSSSIPQTEFTSHDVFYLSHSLLNVSVYCFQIEFLKSESQQWENKT